MPFSNWFITIFFSQVKMRTRGRQGMTPSCWWMRLGVIWVWIWAFLKRFEKRWNGFDEMSTNKKFKQTTVSLEIFPSSSSLSSTKLMGISAWSYSSHLVEGWIFHQFCSYIIPKLQLTRSGGFPKWCFLLNSAVGTSDESSKTDGNFSLKLS